jgi:hypothetical protein
MCDVMGTEVPLSPFCDAQTVTLQQPLDGEDEDDEQEQQLLYDGCGVVELLEDEHFTSSGEIMPHPPPERSASRPIIGGGGHGHERRIELHEPVSGPDSECSPALPESPLMLRSGGASCQRRGDGQSRDPSPQFDFAAVVQAEFVSQSCSHMSFSANKAGTSFDSNSVGSTQHTAAGTSMMSASSCGADSSFQQQHSTEGIDDWQVHEPEFRGGAAAYALHCSGFSPSTSSPSTAAAASPGSSLQGLLSATLASPFAALFGQSSSTNPSGCEKTHSSGVACNITASPGDPSSAAPRAVLEEQDFELLDDSS